jgi:hypothetical protein
LAGVVGTSHGPDRGIMIPARCCVWCADSNWPFTSGESGMKSLKSQAPTLSRQPRNKKPKCDTNMVHWHKRIRMYKNDACGMVLRQETHVKCVFKRYKHR